MKIHWLIYLFTVIAFSNSLNVPKVKLLDGNKMPVVGLGTFLIEPSKIDNVLKNALEIGYKHFDCAFNYKNEKAIGNSLKNWIADGGKRENLYVTSKLPTQAMRPSDVSTALDMTLENLGLDYLDMYLIHVPFGVLHPPNSMELVQFQNGSVPFDMNTDLEAVWKEMEKQVKAGKVKSIGLSNFNQSQILRIWKVAEIKPTNLQVELNLYIQQPHLVKLCNRLGIVVTGYSPFASGGSTRMRRKRETVSLPLLLQHPVVEMIAKKHNKTTAQIALRYNYQRNIVVIPKSTRRERMQENLAIFDFSLTKCEMRQLAALDMKGKYRSFDFTLTFIGVEHHPEYPFTDRIRK